MEIKEVESFIYIYALMRVDSVAFDQHSESGDWCLEGVSPVYIVPRHIAKKALENLVNSGLFTWIESSDNYFTFDPATPVQIAEWKLNKTETNFVL